MISPLPRNKRAKNPRLTEGGVTESSTAPTSVPAQSRQGHQPAPVHIERPGGKSESDEEGKSGAFANSPFAQLQAK